ncbi:MAG: S9 family peptidase [Deltaproteobacteria bacterium]|nr:S9 family peptidase [Deltaproteobacteria bacterium]
MRLHSPALLLALASCAPHTAPPESVAAGPALLPRAALFGNPERANVQVSPDGARLSFLAPDEGVLNVWVAPLGEPSAARAVTKDRGRGVRMYTWSPASDRILYVQDDGGDEDWHLHVVDLASFVDTDLTPLPDVQTRLLHLSPDHPDTLLVALNDRVPELHDVYRIDITTGKRTKVLENPGFMDFLADDALNLRMVGRPTADGGNEYLEVVPDPKGGFKFTPFLTVGQEDSMTTGPFGLDRSGTHLHLMDSRGRDTAAAYQIDLATQKATLLAEDSRADLADVLLHPREHTIQAVAFDWDRRRWVVLDDDVRPDLEALGKVSDGELAVVSRSLDDRTWIVAYEMDTGPYRYYAWDRDKVEATFLFTNRPALEQAPLAPMQPVVIRSRDGLDLVSYLTLPRGSDPDGDGVPASPVPMVLLVHGGPWHRDVWGFDPYHQWLANRGYAVLSVNFRGSTGFGKRFVNAADHEWGAKMHDDLIDAVGWAVDRGIAPADRVAIMGGSYGGYATLVGLTFTPDTFACGVDIVGPSNLATLLDTIPAYWKPMIEMWATRVGDPRTEEGRTFLNARSPLSRVDALQRPLLIGQGANDPRVKQAESDQIVAAMQAREIPVTYVLFPDEGHGFRRPENNLAFNAITEAFLSVCLGGAYEPVGNDFSGSSISVPAGAAAVPGLEAALAARPAP